MTQKNLEKEEFGTVGACATFVEEFNAQVWPPILLSVSFLSTE